MSEYLLIVPIVIMYQVTWRSIINRKHFIGVISGLMFIIGIAAAEYIMSLFDIRYTTALLLILYPISFIQIYIYRRYKKSTEIKEVTKTVYEKNENHFEDIYPDMESYYNAVNKYNDYENEYDAYGKIDKKEAEVNEENKIKYEINTLNEYECKLDEEYSKKKKIEEEAKTLELPDAVYLITEYNKGEFIQENIRINIFDFFKDRNIEEVKEYIEKVEKMIKSTPDFYYLSMSRMNAYRDGYFEIGKEYDKEIEDRNKSFINCNKGFSEKTYRRAIRYKEQQKKF